MPPRSLTQLHPRLARTKTRRAVSLACRAALAWTACLLLPTCGEQPPPTGAVEVLAGTGESTSASPTPLVKTVGSLPADAPPPVILISIDCLNQRQLAEAVESGSAPTLAALRADSLAFMRAYAHAPWTTPSHMSMLTGLYPSQHGRDMPYAFMLRYNRFFDRVPTHPSLAGFLASRGYETTAFVGKGCTSAAFGLGAGFASYHEFQKDEQHRDLSASLPAVRQWLAERDATRPCFLFFHTYDLHAPTPEGLKGAAQVIHYIDGQLATLIAALREAGLYDSALIFFTGDHGSSMIHTQGKCCYHGAGHYEENIHIPLLVKLPDHGRAGPVDGLARHVDIFPTVLDVAGLVCDDYAGPGVSLLDVTSGSVQTRYSFSEADARCSLRYGLVSTRYKYIYTPRGLTQDLFRGSEAFADKPCRNACAELPPREQLFDLSADPFEDHDLLAGGVPSDQAARLDEFRALMDLHLNLRPQYRRRPFAESRLPQSEQLDDELRAALEQLGYLR